MPSKEIIRVLRVLEYVGPRDIIEEVITKSLHGEKHFGASDQKCIIRAATIGTYPEILKAQNDTNLD